MIADMVFIGLVMCTPSNQWVAVQAPAATVRLSRLALSGESCQVRIQPHSGGAPGVAPRDPSIDPVLLALLLTSDGPHYSAPRVSFKNSPVSDKTHNGASVGEESGMPIS